VYESLYGVFSTAFDNIEGLIIPEDGATNDVEMFDPSPVTSEVEFDDVDTDTDLYYPPLDEDLLNRGPTNFDGREDGADGDLESDLDYYFATMAVPASSAAATLSAADDDNEDSEEES